MAYSWCHAEYVTGYHIRFRGDVKPSVLGDLV